MWDSMRVGIEAARCLLSVIPEIPPTAVMDREAGSVNYPFSEDTCNKPDPWSKHPFVSVLPI